MTTLNDISPLSGDTDITFLYTEDGNGLYFSLGIVLRPWGYVLNHSLFSGVYCSIGQRVISAFT